MSATGRPMAASHRVLLRIRFLRHSTPLWQKCQRPMAVTRHGHVLNSSKPIIAKHLFVLTRRFQIIQSILQKTLSRLVQTQTRAHNDRGPDSVRARTVRNNKSPGLRHTLPPSTPPLGSANGLRPSGSDLQQHPPMLRRQHTSVNDAFHGTDTNHTQRNGEKILKGKSTEVIGAKGKNCRAYKPRPNSYICVQAK